MAESPGTWVKLGEQSWQFIPHEVKQVAHKLDLTWEAAATMSEALSSTVQPSDEALKELGAHMHNRVSLKPRDATRDSIEIVEISPRSASTAKVRSAIKLTPAANVEMPPGNFSPPGNFDAPIDTPPGNFNSPHLRVGTQLLSSPSIMVWRSSPPIMVRKKRTDYQVCVRCEHLVVGV